MNKNLLKLLVGAILCMIQLQSQAQRCNITLGDVNYYCGGTVIFHIDVASDTPSYTLDFSPAIALGGDSFMVNSSMGYPLYLSGNLLTASGCGASLTLDLDPYTGENDTITICDTNMLDLMASSGADSYLWSTGDITNFTVINSPGIYWCELNYPLCGIVYDTFVVEGGTMYYPPAGGPTFSLHMCVGDTLLLDAGLGGATYTWHEMGRGMIVILPDTTPTIVVDTFGYYYCTIVDYCGNSHEVHYFVDGSGCYNLVWPGDANADGFDNMYDFLFIAEAYGDTGAARPSATSAWVGQSATDWVNFSTYTTAPVNFKHSDCDGNGVVDYLDIAVNSANYGLVHTRNGEAGSRADNPLIPNVTLHANYDTCGTSTIVSVDILLGDATTPIDSISGIVFEFYFDPNLIDTNSININYSGSWLGTVGSNLISFQKNLYSNARLDMGASRIDNANKNGFGKLATVSFVTTDNLSGMSFCPLNIGDYLAITSGGDTVELDAINDTLYIDPNKTTSIKDLAKVNNSIITYPNPTKDILSIQSATNNIEKATIRNIIGEQIFTKVVKSKQTTIDVSNFENGIYMVEMEVDGTKIYKKIEISR